MTREYFSRTKRILGEESMKKLARSRVAVFGIGGVGGYVVEALARSGIGSLDLIDSDQVDETNLNRQIIATTKTIGLDKVDAAEARVRTISPDTRVTKHKLFYLPETADAIDFSPFDYVVDAVDTVKAKLTIIQNAKELGIPVISAMGCGNRVDPSKLTLTDIYQTSTDPLARVMRRELRKRGIKDLAVVYSTEPAIRPLEEEGTSADTTPRRSVPGSTAFVPPAAGLLIASVVVRELTGFDPAGRTKGGRQD